jgi:hypothetical protein
MEHKVISFSLYGSDDVYCLGTLDNIALSSKIYPGWKVRVYVDEETVPRAVIDKIIDMGSEVVFRNNNINSKGALWRFEVMFDESVDFFIIRDVDSRLSEREKYAVDEWLCSDKDYSVIRDNKYHKKPILAGMWGGKPKVTKKFKSAYDKLIESDITFNYGTDEKYLGDFVWPDAKHNMVCFDTFKTTSFIIGDERTIPDEIGKWDATTFIGNRTWKFNTIL